MKNYTNRKEYIDKLLSYKDKDLIKVVSGLRRSGKSTLLELYREQLLKCGTGKRQIQFYNFELPENFVGKNWDDIYFDIKKKLQADKQNYIFLDEVQNIPSFEKLVDGLFATKNVDVYITGSNAFLLSSELATLLSGRYIEISILPFSFNEYLIARNIDTNNKYLNYEALFFDYVNETSLPKGVELRELGFDKIYEYLEAIYTTIVEKDITQRHQINDKRAFANIVKFMATNVGNAVSPNNISNMLKQDGQSIHRDTVEKYLRYLTGSFVFYKVNRFDLKGRKQLATQEKYYLVDMGFINILQGKERTTDRGHILENVVYLELLRRGNKIWTGTSRNSEVDFVCKTKTGDIEYYQVAWQMNSENTIEREFGALEKIKDNYPKYLLTTDGFTQNRNGVRHLNVFDWLLGK
ncbi:ATP-binding protein [Pasteurella atlantica]|uniref:ATP-binding protein n=1 Tax=Pasteurella atlantica TaxID=2827233 RepID=A0ACC6HKC6_9PAST|nr:ATP-binding protein [Pasteurella atlantica]MDP8033110.1 ATP-binding protein [Pasteurella atlantica]MDP8035047.1 ATP-binding protein [Pasteurella atlantica]MDP8036993.1 ATP-binding protein [Pasteurella atlantica]MDP8047481.1 ATP-binding protein [Pasteurella atlantica]MDP8049150.1 ATP-binding protein [Pasteurella atlantica]